MLDISRIEAGAVAVRSEPVDLEQIVEHCRDMLAEELRAKAIDLSVSIELPAAQVQADPARLQQALLNIVSNAVKYNRPGGSIRIDAVRATDAASITVEIADSGIGMTPAQLASLYQPFNRLGRERIDSNGTGIGLVIVKQLIGIMGGTIDIQSQEGEVTRVRLQLPAPAHY